MSTRSTTHFVHALNAKPTAIVYRHSDGYPSGAGADLFEFIDRCSKLRDSRFTDPSYLAAKYVVFLAEMFNHTYDSAIGDYRPNGDRLEFISVGVCDEDPGDIEYRYVLVCDGSGPNHAPLVRCYHREWSDDDNPAWTEVVL